MRFENHKIVNEYAKYVISKDSNKLNNNDWKQIAHNVYKDKVKPLHFMTCKKRLRMPEIAKKAENRVIQLLDQAGLTETKSTELIDESIKLAKKQENAKLLLEQAKYLNELRGLAPNKTVVTETRSYNSDLTGISDVISKEKETKRKLTVSTTINNGSENEEK